MKQWTAKYAVALAAIALCIATTVCDASAWRGATDSSGRTWARVRIDNYSAQDSNWSISNCRTAISSGPTAAITDAILNWSGVATAGHSTYVWVYGQLDGDVYLDNADGGASAHSAILAPVADADGELVVTIAADGSVTTSIEPVAPYGTPSQTGTLASLE